jgi:hypothetical protein
MDGRAFLRVSFGYMIYVNIIEFPRKCIVIAKSVMN